MSQNNSMYLGSKISSCLDNVCAPQRYFCKPRILFNKRLSCLIDISHNYICSLQIHIIKTKVIFFM